MQTDSYLTIKATVRAELKEKGSRFISQAIPVTDRDLAETEIKRISKQYYDATHNCFAYRIGTGQDVYTRFNDDGEPSGTAGRPILQSIEGADLTDILIIVTRYFGGTKLGTGGLIRAYSGAAALALEQVAVIHKYIKTTIRLQYDYALSNLVNTLLQKFNASVDSVEYQQDVKQTILIRSGLAEEFSARIIDQSAGQVSVTGKS